MPERLSCTQLHSLVADRRCRGAKMQNTPGQTPLCCRSMMGDTILGSMAPQEARKICCLPAHYPTMLTAHMLVQQYIKISLLVSKLTANFRRWPLALCYILPLSIHKAPAPLHGAARVKVGAASRVSNVCTYSFRFVCFNFTVLCLPPRNALTSSCWVY